MLAFIHIEKSAGQTFTRIIENNYVLRTCRVAPLKKENLGVFRWDDLKTLLRINPFLKAIAGHSIVPYSDLSDHVPNIRYITILRDPEKRYISQYQYWMQVLNYKNSFEKFLSLEDIKNFQTKKIAGCEDLSVAKNIIRKKIFLTGIVEEFDNFLLILKKKMAPELFNIDYRRKNVAKSNIIKNLIYQKFEKYKEQIHKNNQIDIELYKFVKDIVFKQEKEIWIKECDCWRNKRQRTLPEMLNQEIIGRIYRNFYIGPAVNVLRILNGQKFGGSY